MDCLKLDAKNHRVFFTKIAIPKVEHENEVVIRMAFSGVCGTDLHIIEDKFAAADGVVLGHEFGGTITEVSPKEEIFKVGDRVAVNPNVTCGNCSECRRGMPNFCLEGGMKYTIGISVNGGWAEYCKVRTSLVFKIHDSVTFEQAALCEPLSCITHAFEEVIPPLFPSYQILVVGAGIIGLLWSSLLHFLGHRNVYVVQTSAARRKTFNNLELGYGAMTWDEIEAYAEKCPAWQFNMVIDTSGNPVALEKSIGLLRPGGTLVIFGVADPAKTISISPFNIYKKELSIVGSAINTHTSFQKAVDLLQAMGDKYFTLEKLNMAAFRLSEYENALKQLENRVYTKILFKNK